MRGTCFLKRSALYAAEYGQGFTGQCHSEIKRRTNAVLTFKPIIVTTYNHRQFPTRSLR
ncbi:hypothetical protein M378DRAFT_551141 [Amanita muscaria Koide BX008]|uniref:Uncharacterized protein n=1 Tax=Amanita muscaria (strain Koide BX008) TaxID=946122 RepID=A0A0C2WH21_AMAMK|nr:hypothetical protein M378DRAFT_551141 [Amanita muscaria Koide BX008]